MRGWCSIAHILTVSSRARPRLFCTCSSSWESLRGWFIFYYTQPSCGRVFLGVLHNELSNLVSFRWDIGRWKAPLFDLYQKTMRCIAIMTSISFLRTHGPNLWFETEGLHPNSMGAPKLQIFKEVKPRNPRTKWPCQRRYQTYRWNSFWLLSHEQLQILEHKDRRVSVLLLLRNLQAATALLVPPKRPCGGFWPLFPNAIPINRPRSVWHKEQSTDLSTALQRTLCENKSRDDWKPCPLEHAIQAVTFAKIYGILRVCGHPPFFWIQSSSSKLQLDQSHPFSASISLFYYTCFIAFHYHQFLHLHWSPFWTPSIHVI